MTMVRTQLTPHAGLLLESCPLSSHGKICPCSAILSVNWEEERKVVEGVQSGGISGKAILGL